MATATKPERMGESTHEMTIEDSPGLLSSKDQLRHDRPSILCLPTMVIPTTAPTTVCVVETGILRIVTASRKREAAISALSIPAA